MEIETEKKAEKPEKTDVKSVYKKHVISKRRREFTNALLNSVKRITVTKIEEGEVYCMKYTSKLYETDKWHTLSLVYITEVKGGLFTGINLLYLNPAVTLNLLANAEKVKNLKESVFYRQLLTEAESFPISCAKKTFVHRYLNAAIKVKREDWGLVPLVEKGLFGNLNVEALVEDWKREAEEFKHPKKRKRAKIAQKESTEPEVQLIDDLVDSVFERGGTAGSMTQTLEEMREEIWEDDDI